MFGYGQSDEKPLMSGALPPSRSESAYTNMTPLLSLVQAKQYLGLFSGSGMPIEDDSLDNVLGDLVGWATERVAEYLGRDVLLSDVTDYYPRLARRLALSAAAAVTQDQPLVLEFIADGATTWTAIAGVTMDDTGAPPVLIVPEGDRQLSELHENPTRARYTTHPYDRKGMDLIVGTVLALVDLRWQSRGQPAGGMGESAVRRILGANLS